MIEDKHTDWLYPIVFSLLIFGAATIGYRIGYKQSEENQEMIAVKAEIAHYVFNQETGKIKFEYKTKKVD
jgi:hypothetical protein